VAPELGLTYRLALGGGAVFLGLWAWMLAGWPKPDHLMPHGVMMVFGVFGGASLPSSRWSVAAVAGFMLLGFLSYLHGGFGTAAVVVGVLAMTRPMPAVAACLALTPWFPLAASLVAVHLLCWRWRMRPHGLFAGVLVGIAWLQPDPLATVHVAGLGALMLLTTKWPAWLVLLPALALRLGPSELWPLAAGLGAVGMLTAAIAGAPPRTSDAL